MSTSTSKRHSLEVRAEQALQLANNPAFSAAFDKYRTSLISELERCTLDGSKKTERKALELVRKLQAAIGFKVEMAAPVRSVKLQDHREAKKSNGTE